LITKDILVGLTGRYTSS